MLNTSQAIIAVNFTGFTGSNPTNPTNPTSPRLSSNTFSLRTWAALRIATIATPTVTCAARCHSRDDCVQPWTTVGNSQWKPGREQPIGPVFLDVFSHLQCVQSCINFKICQDMSSIMPHLALMLSVCQATAFARNKAKATLTRPCRV